MIRCNALIQPAGLLRNIYPEASWRFEGDERQVYLTFDDGPIPEVTPWVIEMLGRFSAKSTFFCVGENVQRYPWVYDEIIMGGHSVGNHTFNHIRGFRTRKHDYIRNVEKASRFIRSDLFRPPHGFMTPSQYYWVKQRYRIIMWDLLSCDFDRYSDSGQVISNVIKNVRPGSIITFHDSVKTFHKLKEVLPDIMEQLKKMDYSFCRIEQGIT